MGTQVLVEPCQPNFLFATLQSPFPRVSRCPLFVQCRATPARMLARFLGPALHQHRFCDADGEAELAPSLAVLFLEVLAAGWAPRVLAQAVCAVTRFDEVPVFTLARALALRTRRDPERAGLRQLAAAYADRAPWSL